MKRISVLVLLLSLPLTPQIAFARGDHLEPTRSHDSPNSSVRGYYVKVLSLLYTGFDSKPLARCTVLPSFTAEYAWSLERRPDGVYLRTNMLSENLWYARPWPKRVPRLRGITAVTGRPGRLRLPAGTET